LTSEVLKQDGPIILALDTSSKATSVAVTKGSQTLRSIKETSVEKRSEKLWNDVESLLAQASLTIRDISLFAVCVGPGGFTGLRVGIAAVKGWASALVEQVVGVTSLEAAAFGAAPAPHVCGLVNANRSEVYSQLFSFDHDGVPVPKNDPIVSTLESALERIDYDHKIVFAGDAANSYAELIMTINAARKAGKWSIDKTERCVAEDIARLALLKYARGEAGTAADLKACYIRPAEAEIKLSLGLLGSKINRTRKG
jgi:tRNA threonylcarbamoyladenosine biosynthesis protein TsaB